MTTTTQALTFDLPDPGPGLPSYAFFALSCMAGASAGVLFGDGIRSPAIGLCALAVCFAGAMAGPGRALVLGGFAALVMVTLVLAELHGGLAIQVAASPWPQALALQAVVLACGVAGGGLLFGMLTQHRRAAAGRERRFQGLLQLAGDRYWEMDPSFRFTRFSASRQSDAALDDEALLNRTPWQSRAMGLSAEQIDAHRADLEAHRPFSGLLARRRNSKGQLRTHSLSGEPAYDAQGAFCGYWGVVRDVSDQMHKQLAVTASETRYRELFTRSPSPLFLHRRGIVFDANEAAARLFGFPNAAAMNGFNAIGMYPAGEMRDRVINRVAQLESLAVGDGVPVADFQVRSIDGRALSVQATAVRVDTASGPANLAIFFDITARQAVEGALRRSEAMLSHLFATSPDCIALTEMATGRYAMVNPAFCRLTGFASEEVVGRTSTELGLWHERHTADQLLTLLERHGTVIDLPAIFVAKSGALVSMLLAAGRFVMDGRDYLVVNARDVTESERTRMQHIAILERASIGIAFTRDRRFHQANTCFERMFGWEPGGLLDQPGSVVWVNDADYREVGGLAGPLLAAGLPFESERQMRRRDNSQFLCRIVAQVVDRTDPARGGTIWIAEDVTERRRLDEALAAARDAAEAASRAKSAFLANTSHEIRTPLNGLLGLARLAMQEDLLDARRQQYLAQILDSAQSLAGIMSDILDVSKIEAGKITLEDVSFDLHELLQAVHHAYQPLADVKGLALKLVVRKSLPHNVKGDAIRVRQILSNFITNALKFTDCGEVRIEAGSTPHGRLRFAVTDTGPGIPADHQGKLFSPFTQADSSTTRRYGGTGLGLSVCRELARLMGGEAGLHSQIGVGSTFWAELPLARAQPAPAAQVTDFGDIGRLHGARVLMVEDNPVNMMIAVAMLERWGVLVTQAFDGRAAVQAVHAAVAEGQPFDAVLMDVQMPIMGGHEASRELRRDFSADDLPIIALTAAALVSERQEAMASGMNAFLTKPIDAPKFRDTLAHHVKAKATTQAAIGE
ncbi:MAG: PAS domain S-box protein [Bacteriovorax sp.]|nr:PAS domain S-box protein [Rhizobacter sp.]